MCFDRNINGNKDIKFLECDYLSCVTVRETHFSIVVDIICPPGLNRVNLSISEREAPSVPPAPTVL